MTSERPSGPRVDPLVAEDVLDEALRSPPEMRDAEIARLCGGDGALEREVRSLLSHLPDPESHDGNDAPEPELDLAGRTVGGCRIETLIGRGGTGRVFRATQEWPPRPVAVKVLRPELLGESARRRFRRETRALARLDHPAIARILAAGVQRERGTELPYLVMELVENARTIATWWKAGDSSLSARLETFAMVCDAVHHGHVRGLIHRDLKPSNVLIDGHGRPKVIDFGVASMTGDDGAPVTITRAIAGTPGYMAPEQFEGAGAVDLRADVHGLGLLLHECLAGRPVHAREGLTIAAAARLAETERPPLLGSLQPECRGDLETIVAHALEREPARRYQSALELAADLRRHLAGHPILARPTPPIERLRLLARRNPLAAAGFGIALASLLLGTAASVAFGLRERSAARRATEALASSERALWVSRLTETGRAIESGDAGGARLAGLALEGDTRWPVRLLRAFADESIALHGRVTHDDFFSMMGGAVSPDGSTVAMISDAPIGVRLARAEDLSIIRTLSPGVRAWSIAFDPVHGRLLVAQDTVLHIWDPPWQDPSRQVQLPFPYGTGIAPSPDGTRVALASEGNCCIVDLERERVLARTGDLAGSTTRLDWSPDGSLIAVGVEPESIRLLRATDLAEVARIPSFPRRTLAIDFDPTGRWLAFSGDMRRLRVVEVANPSNMREIALDHSVWGLRWHPDGRRIAIGDRGSGVRLVDVPDDGGPLSLIGSYRGHHAEVWWVEWNPAGDRLYSFGQIEVHAWRDHPRQGPPLHELGASGLALGRTPHGTVAALTGDGSAWELPPEWNAAPRLLRRIDGISAVGATISRDGERWAWIDREGTLTLASSSTDGIRRVNLRPFQEPSSMVSFSPSGSRVAVSGRDLRDPVVVIDVAEGREIARVSGTWNMRPTSLMWLDESQVVAGDYSDARVIRPDASGAWAVERALRGPWNGARATASGSVLTASFSGEIVEREPLAGETLGVYAGLSDMAFGAAISDDDALLAAVGTDRRLHLFDRDTREQLASLVGHPPGRLVHGVEFSADGRRVVTLDTGGGLAVWDTRGPRNAPVSFDDESDQ
jgi:WD40 repeat protein